MLVGQMRTYGGSSGAEPAVGRGESRLAQPASQVGRSGAAGSPGACRAVEEVWERVSGVRFVGSGQLNPSHCMAGCCALVCDVERRPAYRWLAAQLYATSIFLRCDSA